MSGLNESHVEAATLAWLEALRFTVKHGPDIAPGELAAERTTTAKWSWKRASAQPWAALILNFPLKHSKTPFAN